MKRSASGLIGKEGRNMNVGSEKLRIEQVVAFTADLTLKKVYQHSAARLTKFEQVYLKLVAESGIAGYAEVRGNCPYVTHEKRNDILAALKNEFVPLIKEYNGNSIGHILRVVNDRISSCGARTLVDVAFHDLVAKSEELPLCELLGGMKLAEVPGYCGIPFADLEETAHMARRGVEAGFKMFKVRVGLRPVKRDLERLQIVREIAPYQDLAVDANQAWSVQEAINNINAMSDYKLAFVEQPINRDDIRGLRRVRENVEVPIMADESLMSVDTLNRLIKEQAVDMLNIKILKAGGIVNTLQIIQKAADNDIPFLLGSMSSGRLDTAATLHVQASIGSHARYFSSGGFEDILNDPTSGIELKAGKIKVPSSPGLGVDVDEAMLREEFSIKV